MPRRSSEPDDSFTLPTAFARLDSAKLVADLGRLISPRNFPWALQLTRRYFTLAIAWERDHPGTPLAVYRTALHGIDVFDLDETAELLMKGTATREDAAQAAVLALGWTKELLRTLPIGKIYLSVLVRIVLFDALSEPGP